jgi:hypothetical protein
MPKQTAVEYLVSIVQKCIAPDYIPVEIVYQALAMEKEQIEILYTEEQVIEIVKFTISEWTSLNEQRQNDHKETVKGWLDNDLCNFIQSLKQPKESKDGQRV